MDITPSVHIDFQPWRNALPHAAGARLRDDEFISITHQTLLQSGVLKENDDAGNAWLFDASNVRARLFTTLVYGDERRSFGGTFRGTHPLRVALRSVDRDRRNLKELVEIAATGFVLIDHDNLEDISKSNYRRIIRAEQKIAADLLFRGTLGTPAVWVGNPGLLAAVEKDIWDMTDPAGLGTRRRFKNQIERLVSGTLSDRAIAGRYDDKFDNTHTDNCRVMDGTISNPKEMRRRAELARAKMPIVEALPAPITGVEKSAYLREVESLERLAAIATTEGRRINGLLGHKRLLRQTVGAVRQLAHIPASFL